MGRHRKTSMSIPSHRSKRSQPRTAATLEEWVQTRMQAYRLDTLYPGHANIPCLGIATNSDSASRVKEQLKALYQQYGIPFRCHTCGASLEGGRWVGGHYLSNPWIGDHQPPTSAYWWPEKMQYIQSLTSHILVVESQDQVIQTRYPVHPQLVGLFPFSQPHHYPLYVYRFGQIRPQRYIYPQCQACSRGQSHTL